MNGRHRYQFALALFALASLLASCTSEKPRGAGTSSPTASTSSSSSPTPTLTPSPLPSTTPAAKSLSAAFVVYPNEGVALYDVAKNKTTQVVAKTNAPFGLARFKDGTHISYLDMVGTKQVVRTVDFVKHTTTTTLTLTSSDARILAFDWSPDRSTLAVVIDLGASGLKLALRPNGRPVKVIRSLGAILGRGGVEDDDTWIDWSADGRKILVVVTALDPASTQTMFVVRTNGTDVVAPRSGTFARWVGDSNTIFYREYASPHRWFSLDAGTGSKERVDIKAGTLRPSVSPDGTQIAYDTGVSAYPIYVYNVAAGTERKAGSGGIVPVWLSGSTLAYTRVRHCAGSECGPDVEWTQRKPAGKLDLETKATGLLGFPDTFSVDVLYVLK